MIGRTFFTIIACILLCILSPSELEAQQYERNIGPELTLLPSAPDGFHYEIDIIFVTSGDSLVARYSPQLHQDNIFRRHADTLFGSIATAIVGLLGWLARGKLGQLFKFLKPS